jgi:hypothetical protein
VRDAESGRAQLWRGGRCARRTAAMRGDLNLLAHVFAAETTSEPLLRRKVFRFAARHIPFASTLVEENIRWRNSDGLA